MSGKIVEYIEEAPGLIRIKPSIEGLLTTDRYIQIASELLNKGLSQEGNENLKDTNSPELTDNMLLYKEMKDYNKSAVKTVVFSMYGKDYILNSSNIDRMTKLQKNKIVRKPGVNTEAIKESLEEMLSK